MMVECVLMSLNEWITRRNNGGREDGEDTEKWREGGIAASATRIRVHQLFLFSQKALSKYT